VYNPLATWKKELMSGSSRPSGTCGRRTATALALALLTTALGATPRQQPAPYELFARGDGDVKTQYSSATRSTVVQLALAPPGPGGLPSAATLVLQAEYSGAQPGGAPGPITVLAVPAPNANPNVIRNFELELIVERVDEAALKLFYFGQSWGDYGFTPPGGEIRRVAFTMSAAELKTVAAAEGVKGRVLNSDFVLTAKQIAALRLFGAKIGITPRP
jgi:hypothetical protein